jgi:alcohol dehydrogenase
MSTVTLFQPPQHPDRAGRAAQAVRTLVDDLRVPRTLGEFGVTEAHIPALAQGVMKVTRLLATPPRRVSLSDAEAISRQAL